MTWWRLDDRPERTAVLTERLVEMTSRLQDKTAELRLLVAGLKDHPDEDDS